MLRQDLRPRSGPRPAIHGAVVKPDAYLENVPRRKPMDRSTSSTPRHTRTGERPSRWLRWESGAIRARSARLNHLLILNRNDNVIPAVARLSRERPRPTSCWARRRALPPAGRPRRVGRCASGHQSLLPVPRRAAGQPLPRPDGVDRLRRFPCSTPAASVGSRGTPAPRRWRSSIPGRSSRRSPKDHRMGARPRFWLPRRLGAAGVDDIELLQPASYTSALDGQMSTRLGRAAEARAERVPGGLPRPTPEILAAVI